MNWCDCIELQIEFWYFINSKGTNLSINCPSVVKQNSIISCKISALSVLYNSSFNLVVDFGEYNSYLYNYSQRGFYEVNNQFNRTGIFKIKAFIVDSHFEVFTKIEGK